MTTAFPLDLRTEFEIAGAWTDATSKVYQRDGSAPPVTIERGRGDETSQLNASSSAFEVNNRAGQFSPKNPLGPWYGSFGRNTPVRHSIPAQSSYLRLEVDTASYASCPHTSALNVTGDLDLRIDVQPTSSQAAELAGMWSAALYSWTLLLNGDGTLRFVWSTTGSDDLAATSTLPLPLPWGRQCVRVTLQASTGTVTFWTGPAGGADGSTWTQLGAAVVTGATSVYAASLPLTAGGLPPGPGVYGMYGNVYELELRNGIGGTVVAHPVFSAQAGGTTSFADAQANTWTLAGTAEISSRDYRYHGECSALPPKWDSSGTDQSVAVTAGGIWRRLGQGQTPAQSPMRRALTSRSGTLAPVAYWTWEDPAGAITLGSASGDVPMQFDGQPTLATDSSFLASMPLPSLGGGRFRGQVAPYSGAGSIVARFLMKLGTAPSSTTTLVRLVTGGTVPVIDMQVTSAGEITLASSGGAFSVGPLPAPISGGSWAGQDWWMSIELRPSGSSMTVAVVALAPGATVAYGGIYSTVTSAVPGNLTNLYVNPAGGFTDTVMGHFSVQADWETMYDLQQPLDAWAGETAAARFPRLCAEDGIAARVIGPPAYSAVMGPQGIDTPQNLLQSIEDADQGQLFEPRQVLGLGYRTCASLCNQAPRVTADYSQSQLGGTSGGGATGLAPTLDDALLRNDWTVTRGSPGGGQGMTYQYQLDDGSLESVSVAGDYSDSLTANVEDDSMVPDLAGWKVHAGTSGEYRWPVIPFNLRRPAIQSANLYYPLLAVDVGDYVQLVNMPNVVLYDPVKQLAWGLKESLGGMHHTLELNGVPESPYEVIILDDPVYGRADTDGSALAVAVTSTGTTLQVVTTGPSGILWTTSAGDWPFDVGISGERVTVTAVAAAAALSLGTDDGTFESGVSNWTAVGGTIVQSSAHAHSGTYSALLTVSGSPPQAFFRPVNAVPVAPGAQYTASMWLYGSAIAGCSAAIDWRDASGNYLSTSTGASGTATTTWAQFTVTGTAPEDAAYAVYGPTLAGNPENGNQVWTDDVLFTSQAQAFAATRSVNGVVKAQAAGADVRLWFPPILAWQ